jgi:hypothetical protein
MAIYIPIWKTSETEENAIYEFGDGQITLGIIKLEKDTGRMELIGSKLNADEKYTRRAMRKLYLHWKDARYPDKTGWAA